MLLLLEHLGGVVVQVLVGHIVHAVLCKLGAGSLLGSLLDVVVVNLDFLGGNQLLSDEVPCQLVDAGFVVLLYKLLTLVLVVGEHDALEQGVGELELADLLLAVLAHVHEEAEVGVDLKLSLEVLGNLGAESSLVGHVALAVYAVEELLINLVLGKVVDFLDLIAEVAGVLGYLLAVYLEE